MNQQYSSSIEDDVKIVKYSNAYREQILAVWENSVLATHNFLNANDFKEIKTIVLTIDFNDFEVYCLTRKSEVVGFVGVAEKKIEMLFLLPEHIGKGHGKKLVDFALSKLNAEKVDVNEQNTNAVKFYESLGFRTYERREKDDQGKDYPLLRMKFEK